MNSKTWNLVLSIWHLDSDAGNTGAQRLCYESKEERDKELAELLGQAHGLADGSGRDAYVLGPDCRNSGIILERDDLSAIHYRVEDPPKPPETVAVDGKDYVKVKTRDGEDVLWPATWFIPDGGKPAAAALPN